MAFKRGDRVRVMFGPEYKIKDGSRACHGKDYTVARRKVVNSPRARASLYHGLYYELEGAVSREGVNYAFLEDMLVPLDQ